MTRNDSIDPARKDDAKKSPLGDPSIPPNPSVRASAREAASQTGATDSRRTSASNQGRADENEKAQKILDEVAGTSERLKAEARDKAERRAEQARARAGDHASHQYESQAQHSRGAQSVLGKLGQLTRDRPGVVLGGAAVAGFCWHVYCILLPGKKPKTATGQPVARRIITRPRPEQHPRREAPGFIRVIARSFK